MTKSAFFRIGTINVGDVMEADTLFIHTLKQIKKMKKFLLSLVALLGMSAVAVALPNSTILLQHQGHVVHYPLDSLNAALRDAVDGDTLFLSKGTFPGFTIDKKITVRGVGQETIINGRVTVAVPDSVTLTSTMLEGLYLTGYYDANGENNGISVITPLNGFKIKQCCFKTLTFSRTMSDVVLDRCYCSSELSIPRKVLSLKAVNSKIYRVRFNGDSSRDITFINSNILTFSDFENFRGTCLNSITGYGRSGSEVSFRSCNFINSLVCTYRLTIDKTCYKENCWQDGTSTKIVSDYTLNCMYSDEELIEKGYIGNDGTVIGCNGGVTPYTLKLAIPVVTESDVKLDADKRELNVKLTLTAN